MQYKSIFTFINVQCVKQTPHLLFLFLKTRVRKKLGINVFHPLGLAHHMCCIMTCTIPNIRGHCSVPWTRNMIYVYTRVLWNSQIRSSGFVSADIQIVRQIAGSQGRERRALHVKTCKS